MSRPSWTGSPSASALAYHGRLVLLAALALLLRGYVFPYEDHHLYLPFVLRWAAPGLFPTDPLLQMGFARESVIWPALAWAGRWVSLPAALLVLHLAATYLSLMAVQQAAALVWRRAEAGWVAVLLWLPTYAIPGTGVKTFDVYFTGRILAWTCGFYALVFFLRRRRWLLAASVLLGALLHVISILPVASAIVLAALLRRRWREAAAALGAAAAGALGVLALSGGAVRHELLALYDGAWRQLLEITDPSLFPSEWPAHVWVALAFYAAALGAVAWVLHRRRELPAEGLDLVLVSSGILLYAGAGLAGSALHLAIASQACALRGMLYLMLALVLLLSGPIEGLLFAPGARMAACGMWAASCWVAGGWHRQLAGVAVLLCAVELDALKEGWAWLIARRRLAWSLFLTAVTALGAYAFAFTFLGVSLRAWIPDLPTLLVPVTLTYLALVARALARTPWRKAPALVLAGCLLVVALVTPISFTGRDMLRPNAFPGMVRAWLGLSSPGDAAWDSDRRDRRAMEEMVRRAVPERSTVLVPPDWEDFRLVARRSPFVTWEDRQPSEFDRAYAMAWRERMDAIRALRPVGALGPRMDPSLPLTADEVLALRDRYPSRSLTHVVSRASYPFELVGSQGPFRLYALAPSR